jgi:hypothetical protein
MIEQTRKTLALVFCLLQQLKGKLSKQLLSSYYWYDSVCRGATTLGITTLSIMSFIMTLSINNKWRNVMLSGDFVNVMLSVIILSVVMLNVLAPLMARK